MTQVVERPPNTSKSTDGQRFYLLATSDSPPTLYWEGDNWMASPEAAKAFSTYEAAEREKPQAVKKAPVGTTVVIFKLGQ